MNLFQQKLSSHLGSAANTLGKRLDYCWVCENQLMDGSVGSADHLREEHHIIPKAYGGADGPTVSLCASHHSLLHLIAVKILSQQDIDGLISGILQGPKDRLLYLATRVVVAARLTEDDPNKRVAIHVSVSRSLNTEIARLAQFKNSSKEDLIIDLLKKEINRCFPKRNNVL